MKYKLEPLENLVDQFERLPGIGRKTAQRLAFYLINEDSSYAENFSNAILNAKKIYDNVLNVTILQTTMFAVYVKTIKGTNKLFVL